jgi:predicted permease
MLHDLRSAWRALAKRPSFAAGTVLVLGLAIGVNTAVFSLVNALLLRPLDVPNAERIGFVYRTNDQIWTSFAEYRELGDKVTVFAALAARASDTARMQDGVDAIPIQGEAVTSNYFDVLGVAPERGRGLSITDTAGAPPVAVISHALWKARFGGDPGAIGRGVRLGVPSQFVGRYADTSRDYEIVGVMPASFVGTGNPWQPAQYWVSLDQRAVDDRAAHGDRDRLDERPVVPIGLLRATVSFAQARAAVDVTGRDIWRRSGKWMTPSDTFLLLTARRARLPFQGAYYMDVPRILATLGAIAMLLLVIAGANLTGMLLARGVARRAEIAIRLSLGISRVRLAGQLLTETALVATASGGAGLLVARVLVFAALRGLPSHLPGTDAAAVLIEVPIDPRVLAFAFGSGLLTAVIVGFAPAVQALRVDLLAALTLATPTAARSRSRLRRLVLVPQVALTVVLLLVSGVFVRTLLGTEFATPGYAAEHVVVIETAFPQRPWTQQPMAATAAQRRAEAADMRVAQSRIVERLAALPGIASAAVTAATSDGIPLPFSHVSMISRTDYETTREYRGAVSGWASADYFKTLGIALLRGRLFDARERADASTSVIVSERLANELWPGGEPVGQQLALHDANSQYPIRWLDVVGEVASVTRPVDEYPRPALYLPIESQPLIGTSFLVRGAGNPAELAAAAKQAIVSAEPTVIVTSARPLGGAVSDARYPRRFSAGLVGASGLAALLLAAIGVFALTTYAVAQRIGEIGIRMVLGAGRRDIVRLIVREGAVVALVGIALGFALAFAAIRTASHAIVPLPDLDAATFVAVPVILAAVVLAACYLPARRAALVDPLVVLRRT